MVLFRESFSLGSVEKENLQDCIRHLALSLPGFAHKFVNRKAIDIDSRQLIGPGFLGLIRAVENFDVSKGIEFRAYASVCIRGVMLEELRQMDFVPRGTRKVFGASLDAAIWANKLVLFETADPRVDVEEETYRREICWRFVDCVAMLPLRERRVICLVYNEGLTMREAGEVLKKSEGRISQIHSKAIVNLRNCCRL